MVGRDAEVETGGVGGGSGRLPGPGSSTKETSQRSLGRREGVPKQEVKCVIRLVVQVQESVVCCDGESGNGWKCGGGPE